MKKLKSNSSKVIAALRSVRRTLNKKLRFAAQRRDRILNFHTIEYGSPSYACEIS